MKLPTEIIEILRDPELAPEGVYELEVEGVNGGVSQNGHSYRIVVDFQVTSGEYEGYKMKSVFAIYNPDNFTSQSIGGMLFRSMLLALGISESQITEEFDTDILIGRRLKGYVVKEKSVGNYPAHNRVSRYMPLTAGGEREIDKAE